MIRFAWCRKFLTGCTAVVCLGTLCSSVLAQTSPKSATNKPPAKAVQRPAQPSSAAKPQSQPQAIKPEGQSVLETTKGSAKPAPVVAADKKTQADNKFVLQHKLKPGDVVRTRTTHLANTLTRIQGTEDVSESRTSSDKVWQVKALSPEGEMTFEYRIEAVDMSQKAGDAPEVKYSSRTDKEAPPIFAHVAKTIIEPVATVTIDASGTVIERDNKSKAPPLGMGELAVPLPKEPVALGASWSIPREARVKLENGTQKTMKLREQYTLEKVSAGIATIRVETQPLTPVNDPGVEAQLMQQMSQGTIKFDIDRGRLVSKELSWDDEVVGFRGAETSLQYTARFTEEPIEESTQSAQATGSVDLK